VLVEATCQWSEPRRDPTPKKKKLEPLTRIVMTEWFMFWQYASELFARPGSLPLATPQPIPWQAFAFEMVKCFLRRSSAPARDTSLRELKFSLSFEHWAEDRLDSVTGACQSNMS